MAFLDEIAAALGVDGLDERGVEALLDLARDVAHGTERKNAPLASYLVGIPVGKGMGMADAVGVVAGLASADD
ncbi:MAG: molybdopterin-guanine dinucleotide biosynthesis protein [Acidimicrobiia bacterium]|nr:molybdopterin-guanine dinucleotide biosynthesis protein [Acidimicrobiia bacterium]